MLHKALEKWSDSVVQDGSIGDGHEINTNPSGGDLFLDHIRDLCDGFEAMGVSANEKCGMHVHVNAKDVSFYDLRRVIVLYNRIERALFDACHPRRLNYQYSLKCGDFFLKNVETVDPRGFKQSIYGQLYANGGKLKNPTNNPIPGESEADRRQRRNDALRAHGRDVVGKIAYKSHNLRYKALNLHSYFMRGSVEFRHHEGSTDYDVITGFGRICAEIISKANAMTEAQILALHRNSRKAMLQILPADLQTFIVGEWTKHDQIINDDVKKNNYSGYRDAYQKVWDL